MRRLIEQSPITNLDLPVPVSSRKLLLPVALSQYDFGERRSVSERITTEQSKNAETCIIFQLHPVQIELSATRTFLQQYQSRLVLAKIWANVPNRWNNIAVN